MKTELKRNLRILKEYKSGRMGYGRLAKKYGLSKSRIPQIIKWTRKNEEMGGK